MIVTVVLHLKHTSSLNFIHFVTKCIHYINFFTFSHSIHSCVPLENITLYTLQFADDQVVLAGDKEDLEYMTCKLKETYEKWGLDMNFNKTKYFCIWGTHNNMKSDKDNEIEFCQEYKYLGIIFDTSGTDDKEMKSRVIQARKCIACLNGILWSTVIRKEGKLNIYNALTKSSLLYGSETWRLTENNK